MCPIHTVLICEPDGDLIAHTINGARPDLDVRLTANFDIDVPEAPFACITFAPDDHINRFEAVRWIHCAGAGVDRLLSRLAFTPPRLTRTVGAMGEQIGEYVLAYVLADCQKLRARAALQRDRHWSRDGARPQRLAGQTALIVGTGAIGTAIAHMLTACGVACHGVSRSGLLKAPFLSVSAFNKWDATRAADADILIMALPGGPGTEGLMDAARLGTLSNVLLINIGRGTPLCEEGLRTALGSGAIRHAVLDVFVEEPLDSQSWLWAHPQVTVTPHVSGITQPQDTAAAFLEELEQWEQGGAPLRPVCVARGY